MQTLRLSLVAFAVAIAASTLATPAMADNTVAFNVGAVTDYRYRGISQSRLKPAVSGGIDYTAGSFYVGAWASTIQWIKDGGGDSNVEVDIYGGYKFEIDKGTVLDLGVLTYQYPSNRLRPSANTTEVYGAITFGPVTAKYSHSTTNLFGFAGSKGSGYFDLTGNFEVAGVTVTPHVGRQSVKNNGAFAYTDYSITLSKEMAGVVWSAALVDTNTKAYTGAGGKDLGKASVVLGAKYSF